MANIIIRPAMLEDAEQIHEFIIDLASFEKSRAEVKSTIGDVRKSLFSDDCKAYALIAERRTAAVGMAVYFFNYSTWLGRNGLYLEDLYVSQGYRGLGVGKMLMSHLAAIAMQNSCHRMEWSVLKWNQQAIDVYNSMDAERQNEWVGYRLSGDALKRLAQFSTDN
ncbi:GNAT family N-acetyltransferase [Granulosicoccus antarcticus]|uniref:N-acetyltransferase domain-containing protein n=1 Tax=Granulosicoccus antarcticus IMCC3135 TaxID=1192854 RepID=A0A2Z2NTT0_9GAMM|nr:GNAT family N-acetyltransferase [Granulosicoccus antarcticus]ASJ74719.1 hypothetical protein IMCC3135_23250 [Granulosicoccus antarcticus IMCC3135]